MDHRSFIRTGALAMGLLGLLLAWPAGAQSSHAGHGMDQGGATEPATPVPAMERASMPGMAHGPAPASGDSGAVPAGTLPSSDGTGPRGYDDYGIHAHMMDGMTASQLLFDKFGLVHDREGRTGLQWDGEFWVGRGLDRLWVKSEGERMGGASAAKIEAFWSRAVSPYWDAQVGARRDFGTGPKRDWLAFGLQGVAPYEIETELTAYVGKAGRTALGLKAEYDLLLTQRLVFTPEIEASLYGKDDPARGIGAGLADAALTLRLRYEITRQFAPYVGVSFGRKFGQTARYASEAGESRSERALLAGVRIWF